MPRFRSFACSAQEFQEILRGAYIDFTLVIYTPCITLLQLLPILSNIGRAFMKTGTIKAIIYGIFIVGSSVAFISIAVPALSDLTAVFACLGGAIVICGLIFCVMILRAPNCPFCRELLGIRNPSPVNCPHCGEKVD